jgi:hypothetical protein
MRLCYHRFRAVRFAIKLASYYNIKDSTNLAPENFGHPNLQNASNGISIEITDLNQG